MGESCPIILSWESRNGLTDTGGKPQHFVWLAMERRTCAACLYAGLLPLLSSQWNMRHVLNLHLLEGSQTNKTKPHAKEQIALALHQYWPQMFVLEVVCKQETAERHLQ